ncbi:hypothetical protein, partial [uncultured Alistipes sp.]|uniref:hypothetical protein n=1 Tax=uncultured Alistipes sp. TaxID=538949 RepID=UPI00262D4D97
RAAATPGEGPQLAPLVPSFAGCCPKKRKIAASAAQPAAAPLLTFYFSLFTFPVSARFLHLPQKTEST